MIWYHWYIAVMGQHLEPLEKSVLTLHFRVSPDNVENCPAVHISTNRQQSD
jgi:hypothetical protein